MEEISTGVYKKQISLDFASAVILPVFIQMRLLNTVISVTQLKQPIRNDMISQHENITRCRTCVQQDERHTKYDHYDVCVIPQTVSQICHGL